MLIIGRDDVRALLDLDALIEALAAAMADLSAGRASVPARVAAFVDEHEGFLAAMPGYVPSLGALTTKLVTLFPLNDAASVPTHQAVIVAFDPESGSPVALIDGTEITAVRTGAGSALSARLLARDDASVLAILGTGVQARAHARALPRVRPIREIRVAGRSVEKAEAVARELREELDVEVHATASYEEASRGADVVCATTPAHDPIVRREWLSPGVHVTSVGFNPGGREVDDETIAGALVCVESRSAVLAPPPAGSSDLLEPIRTGVITEADIHAEVGELLLGSRSGRTSPEQITLYKSVGVAVQDAAAAALVLAAAREQHAGREIAL
jgi:ornithine cyclodeaminase